MNKMKIKRYNLFLFLFEEELSSKPIIFTLQVYDVFSFFKTCFYLKIKTAKIHIFYRLFYEQTKMPLQRSKLHDVGAPNTEVNSLKVTDYICNVSHTSLYI